MIFDRLICNYHLYKGWDYATLADEAEGDERRFLIKNAIKHFQKAIRYDFESKPRIKQQLKDLFIELKEDDDEY